MTPPTRASRRRFLEASAGSAVGAWLASSDARGVARAWATARPHEKLLGTLPFVGEGRFPLDTTAGAGLRQRRALDLSRLSHDSLVIPQDEFFVRTGRPDRLPAADNWKVRVYGLVETVREIGWHELRREASDRGVRILECAGNSRAAHFGFMSAARWAGVPLERLWERAGPLTRATQVLVSGFDEHAVGDPGSVRGASWVFGLDQIREAGAFLATEMNGASLHPDHGYPVRLVVPGWYACVAIKWVNEIVLVDDKTPATEQMKEFAGRTHQEPTGPNDRLLIRSGRRPEGPSLARDFQPARIDPAALPVRVEKLDAGEGKILYRIIGILWGGPTAARDLQIRLNPNLGFAPVEEIERADGQGFTLWSHTLRAPAHGRYRIELRVKDPGVRTRRLDMGFYAREILIPSG
jgi:DMSO/TMAO reductase YedYZ molybdopterin-dependent catalytic subunit